MTTKLDNKITKLDCSGDDSIYDQNDIDHLINLIKLDASNNPKIKSVNNFPNLKKLKACGNCGIDNDGIKNSTSIEELDIAQNDKIWKIDNLKKLKILIACENNNDFNNVINKLID